MSTFVVPEDFKVFTWVFFHLLKYKGTSELINFIKGIDVLTKLLVKKVCTDNETEFTNASIEKFLVDKGI